ncbi:MAG: hypothetical protein LBT84_05215 [Spirochaetia bacterium]|jgi:hypothetical protein|nr:hypothetical protein [Spirochaetia bacterium]
MAIIFTFFLFLAIWLLWNFLWKDYALDKLRDDLFYIRNDLFDIASTNKEISFNHTLYLTFEAILNNSIRYGFKLTFMSAVIFNFFVKRKYNGKVGSRIESEFIYMIDNIKNKDLKDSLLHLKSKFEKKIFYYLLKTSLILMFFFVVSLFYAILAELSKKAVDSIFKNAANNTIMTFKKSILRDIEFQVEALT